MSSDTWAITYTLAILPTSCKTAAAEGLKVADSCKVAVTRIRADQWHCLANEAAVQWNQPQQRHPCCALFYDTDSSLLGCASVWRAVWSSLSRVEKQELPAAAEDPTLATIRQEQIL